MQERRRFVRWQINQDAKVALQDAEPAVDCNVRDISYKGAQISLREQLQRDTFLKLNFMLSDDVALDAESWVAWHKTVEGRNTYGLYFSKIKDSDKEKIYQFIRCNYPKEMNLRWWEGA